ncbi:uncharacterized protein LOC121367924 [Gigantopelta aegis]|uniref:uncharacterized protein LOC121367924 n=1 Tax=Gigantopelta aegis TaxID=1735272 RepID=UPI001B88D0D1|nr:uncharacterized protein LOC121367924 [Gigantopelta aegis]
MNGNNNLYGAPNPAPGVTTVWVSGQDDQLSPMMNNFGSLSLQDAGTAPQNQFFIPQQTFSNTGGVTTSMGLTSNLNNNSQYYVVSVTPSPMEAKPELQPFTFPAADSNINLYANGLINDPPAEQKTLTHQTVTSPALVTQNLVQQSAYFPQATLYQQPQNSFQSGPLYSSIPVNGFEPSSPMSTKLIYNSTGEPTESSSNTDFSSTASSPYGSLPSSPRPEQQSEPPSFQPVAPNYTRPKEKDLCMRCGKKVYAMEKIGPVKYVVYHKLCFRCVVCTSLLTLKNFHHNPNEMEDLNVYCQSHRPKEDSGTLDANSVSIQKALKVPKLGQVNEQVRGGPDAMKGGKLDINTVSIQTALNAPKADLMSPDLLKTAGQAYFFDSEDINVQHVRNIPATDLHVANKQREKVWSRNERKAEPMPPQGVMGYSPEEEYYQRQLYQYEGVPQPDYY